MKRVLVVACTIAAVSLPSPTAVASSNARHGTEHAALRLAAIIGADARRDRHASETKVTETRSRGGGEALTIRYGAKLNAQGERGHYVLRVVRQHGILLSVVVSAFTPASAEPYVIVELVRRGRHDGWSGREDGYGRSPNLCTPPEACGTAPGSAMFEGETTEAAGQAFIDQRAVPLITAGTTNPSPKGSSRRYPTGTLGAAWNAL